MNEVTLLPMFKVGPNDFSGDEETGPFDHFTVAAMHVHDDGRIDDLLRTEPEFKTLDEALAFAQALADIFGSEPEVVSWAYKYGKE